MRSRSSVVVPGRLPWSRSACRTQLDSVCAVQPILAAIDTIAAHCDVCSVRCSNTIRTARSRTSAENFGHFDSFVMGSSLSRVGASGKPGAVHSVEDFPAELVLFPKSTQRNHLREVCMMPKQTTVLIIAVPFVLA